MSEWAPSIITLKIDPEKIRDVIGKGGAVIRQITEETGTTIDIENDGTVKIASVSGAAGREAQRRIELITADVEVGQIYEGKVAKLMDFGAFVTILPGRDGLVHISQISDERVERVSDKLKEGDHDPREGARGRSAGAHPPVDAQRRRGLKRPHATEANPARSALRTAPVLSGELPQTLLEVVADHAPGGAPVRADHLREKVAAHERLTVMLLLGDHLQQDAARDVPLALLVDHDKVDALDHQAADVGEGDVAALNRVV